VRAFIEPLLEEEQEAALGRVSMPTEFSSEAPK